jgi:hypothetical protein
MLPPTISNGEYSFVAEKDDGLFIYLVTQAILEAPAPKRPLWHIEAGDEKSMTALMRWMQFRRPLWQSWGLQARTMGHHAFDVHMRKLLADEPPSVVTATSFSKLEDPRDLRMGEVVHGINGHAIEALYEHRFETAKDRRRFFSWLSRNHDIADGLVVLAFRRGTDAVAQAMDQIAAGRGGLGLRGRLEQMLR